MNKCQYCVGGVVNKLTLDIIGNFSSTIEICNECKGTGFIKQTNADKIRSMSDEKLAEFITSQRKSKCNDGICVGSEYCYYNNDNECSCNSSILEWLKSEVPE